MKRCLLPVIVIMALALAACVRRPEHVVSDEKMARVVADLELAEAYMESMHGPRTPEKKREIVDFIIDKHGLSREDFDSTMSWYGRNIDAYYAMCDMAEKQLADRKRRLAGNKSVEVESSDLWPYQRQSFLSPISGTDAFRFSLPVSDVQKGQRLNLKFRLNNPVSANALFGVEYDNGEKSYITRPLYQTKSLDLSLQTDTGKTVSRIFGNMTVSDQNLLPLWLDSIYLKALPFDSMEYYKIHVQKSYREPKSSRRNTADPGSSTAEQSETSPVQPAQAPPARPAATPPVPSRPVSSFTRPVP